MWVKKEGDKSDGYYLVGYRCFVIVNPKVVY